MLPYLRTTKFSCTNSAGVFKLALMLFSVLSALGGWSQTTIYASSVPYEFHVNNATNSIDTSPNSFSELVANSGGIAGIGSYTGIIELQFPALVSANQTCFVRIETDDNILESLMGGTIGDLLSTLGGAALSGNQEFIVQVKNGANVVLQGNSANPNEFSGELLKVVVNEFGETYLAITPQQDYQSIRITNITGALIGLNSTKTMRVYDPYYVPNGLECGKPTFTGYDTEGITLDLLALNAGATNIHNAIDSDINSFSQLSLGVVTLPSWIEQKVYFEGLSNSSDIFGIRFRVNPLMNLVNVANNINLKAQNGALPVASCNVTTVMTPQDYDSLVNGNPTTIYFQPNGPTDRIIIRLSSLLGVSLDQFLEIYHVFKIAPAPVYDVVASNDTVCKGSSASLVATASDPTYDIRWYTDSVGGNYIGTTASGAAFNTPDNWNDTTYWVAAGRPGCPDETFRTPVNVWVIETPNPLDITFNINPNGYCSSDSVVIVPNSSVGNQIQWFLDPQNTQPIADGQQDGNLTFGIGSSGELIIEGANSSNSPLTLWAAVQDTVTMCWNAPGETASAFITILDEPAPTTSNAVQSFCASNLATVGDLQVDQSTVNWYDANGTLLPSNTQLVNGENYYATSVGVLCESSDSLLINVTIVDEPAPTTSNSNQQFCMSNMATVGDIQVDQQNVNWYDANGNSVSSSTLLIDGMNYYATAQGTLCESTDSLEIAVTFIDEPAATTNDSIQYFCPSDNPTLSDLVVNEPNVNWYDALVNGNLLPNSSPLIDGTSYYATSVGANCESSQLLTILVLVDSLPTPTTQSLTQVFCETESPTIGEIQVNESNVVWYSQPTGGSQLPMNTLLVDGSTYYASLVSSTCESGSRLQILVTFENVAQPSAADTIQFFCDPGSSGSVLTVDDININEPNIIWYDAPTGGNQIPNGTPLVDGATYYAAQQGQFCESVDRLMIQVSIGTVSAPTTNDASPIFCSSSQATIGDLQVNETSINWYDSLGTALSSNTLLVDGMSYYANQVIGNCESSDQLVITVSIEDQNDAEFLGQTQNICNNDTIVYEAPSGMNNYNWTVNGGIIISGDSTNQILVVWNSATGNSIEVSYESSGGCISTMAESIPVNVVACSDLSIEKTVDNESPLVGDQVTFTITVTNTGDDLFNTITVIENIPSGYTYVGYSANNGGYDPASGVWSIYGLGTDQTATLEIIVTVNSSGDYLNTATIDVSDPIDSDLSNNSSSASAEPNNCMTVYNEITPNNDGINDVLYIDCIESYPDNSITIFNRYGNQVYYMEAYANNWDGVANSKVMLGNGEVLPSGTYYYILRVESEDFEVTGWIYIIR